MVTDSRAIKFELAAANKQLDLTIILENVHDPHNIGAVMRSCDSVGIVEMYVILTDGKISSEKYLKESTTSKGAKKWLKLHVFSDVSSCMIAVKKRYNKIYGTHLGSESTNLYDLDLSNSVALMFGNERDGISQKALSYLDGNFLIPQYGLVQSLNISVACAVSLYEASRQRREKGKYPMIYDKKNTDHVEMYDRYISIHRQLNNK